MQTRRLPSPPIVAALFALALAGCSTSGMSIPGLSSSDQPPPPPAPAASIPAEDLVGRWGFAAYHKPADRPRIEKAAARQCRKPYVIGRGPNGGVMMLTHDSPQPQELRLKGSSSGKNYIGPPGPSGQPDDREVVAFDGRILVLAWVDPEVAGRYGTAVYVRCGPRA
jgi:hypothetical protein